MKILDNSDKYLMPVLPQIISEKLDKKSDNIKFIGGGSYGRVYKTSLSDGETIAVKAYRVQGSQYEEAEQLNLLSANTSVKMPEVLFTYEDNETAIMAMTFVEGQNVLNPAFLLKSKNQKQKFADDVISGMLQWHSVTNGKFGSFENPVYDNWYEYYKKEKQEPWLAGLKELSEKGKVSKKNLKLLCEATEIFNNLPEENSSPVLIHSDLNIMNIMADPKTFELTGFIDPCDSMWANREYDLYQLRNMWGDLYGIYDTYKKYAKLSDNCDFKIAYYGFVNEIKCFRNSGEDFAIWRGIWSRRLRKELSKF